jgi:hypothetical protein
LANLIGLGGLAKRVMKIFKKIRKRVDKMVNKLLAKAKKAGRKLLSKLGLGKKGKKGSKPEDDKRTQAEMKKDLHLGVKEGTEFLKKGGRSKKEIDKRFKKIESKYLLEELTLEFDGENKAHVHGKVNPEEEGSKINDFFEVVRNDFQNGSRSEDESGELYSLFRTVSAEELEAMRKEKKLTIRVHEKDNKKRKVKKGDPKGQPFLSTDAEYSKKLMKRKYELGKKENDETVKKMYEYLVQIDFIQGTKNALQDPETARYEKGDTFTKNAFRGHKARGKNERGIIVLKLEPKAESGNEKVLNYGITPKNWDLTDPLQVINFRIAKITVIAKITE